VRSLQDLVDSFGEIGEINMGVGVDQGGGRLND
jgi:hypothetical protein